MKKELCIKEIFEDFTSKIILNDIEKEVLLLYVKNESIVKIADKTKQSTSTVSRTVAQLKEKYNNYKKMEIRKLEILKWRYNDNLYCFFYVTIYLGGTEQFNLFILWYPSFFYFGVWFYV